MTENRVVALRQKGAIDDPLTEILRTGARRLIAQAVEAEFEAFLGSTAELVLPDGRRRVVRHGHDPVRAIQTGIGPIEVQKPKARDPRRFGRAHSLHVEHPAQMGAPHQEPRRPSYPFSICAGFPPAISRRRSPPARQGRAQPFRGGDRVRLKSEWEDEYRRWQKRGFVGAFITSTSGGRRLLPAGAHGKCRMHAGADGGDAVRARRS